MPIPTPRDWFSILALGLIWGATFMAVTLALEGYGPLTVAAARTGLGAAAMWLAVALRVKRWPEVSTRLVAHLLAIGVLSTALPFFLLSWGQLRVPSAFAGLSMAMVPLFVAPLAHVFVPGERLGLGRALGLGLGLAGVMLLIGPGAFAGESALAAQLACLAAALCYAISSVVTRACPQMDPVLLTAVALSVGSGVLVPAMLWFEGPPVLAAPRAVAAIILLGLVPTALAALLRVQVIRSAGPSFMTMTSYQVPLWSAVFGVLILGEKLPGAFGLALALILVGLGISQRRRG